MERESNENNLSLQTSQDEEDVYLQNEANPILNNIIQIEDDKVINEDKTVTIKKEIYEQLEQIKVMYEFVTSDEYIKNVRYESEDKPLHIAAALGRLDMVQKLVEMGHNVNVTNTYNEIPLHRAVYNGNLSVVQYLIEKNSLINAQADDSCSPLHIAARMKHLSIVQYLVEKNACLFAQTYRDFYTSLHSAVSNNNTEILEYLCSLKDSSLILRMMNINRKTPLDLARDYCNKECIKIIEKHINF